MALAAGSVAGVAKAIEIGLARLIPLVIGLLASLIGLGGLSKKVMKIFKKIRKRIDKAVNKLLMKAKKAGRKLMRKLGIGKKKDTKKDLTENEAKNSVDAEIDPKSYKVGKKKHTIFVENGSLMMKSNKTRLEGKLEQFRTDQNAAQVESAIGLQERIEAIAKQLKKKNLTDTQRVNYSNEAEQLETQIVPLLQNIFYGSDGDQSNEMKLVEVTFTKDHGSVAEYNRQLQLQETELNSLKVGNWQKARIRFQRFGRDHANDTKSNRREAFIQVLMNEPVAAVTKLHEQQLLNPQDSIRVNYILNSSTSESEKQVLLKPIALKVMGSYSEKRLAVLHTLDQIAGGDPTKYGDNETMFGDTSVNSDIGNQWDKHHIKKIDTGTKGVIDDAQMKVKIN